MGAEILAYLIEWITATLALTMSRLLAEFWIFVRALMTVGKSCIRIWTLKKAADVGGIHSALE